MSADSLNKVLSSYYHLGSTAYTSLSALTPDDAHDYLRWFLLDSPIVPVLITFHTLFAALKVYELTPPRTFWLKSLVLTAFAAYGGSTLSSVLVGRPVPLFTTASNVMVLHVLLSWYIVNQSRVLRYLLTSRPIMSILSFGAAAAKSRAVFSFMDDYVRQFPSAVAGAILLSGLAGSGGQLFLSLEKIVQRGFQASSEFSAPGWGFKSAYIASVAYYLAVDPRHILRNAGLPLPVVDRSTARFYISAAFCFHAMLETMYGAPINPLFWLDSLFYAATGLRHGVKTDGPVVDVRPMPTVPQSSQPSRGRPSHLTSDGLRKRR